MQRRTFQVERKVANGRLVGFALGKSASIQIDMVRGAQYEYAASAQQNAKYEGNSRQGMCNDSYGISTCIPEVSMLLYAQAAVGPEYEYPACLCMRVNLPRSAPIFRSVLTVR